MINVSKGIRRHVYINYTLMENMLGETEIDMNQKWYVL